MRFTPKPADAYIPITRLWVKGASILDNVRWLSLELVFSKQIVGIMTNTASVTDEKMIGSLGDLSGGNKPPVIGMEGGLEKFLPANLFGRLAEAKLVEMLIAKYCAQYGFIKPSREHHGIYTEPQIYRFNKDSATNLTVYLGQLDAIYLGVEILITAGSWMVTNHAIAALAIVGALEMLRRFKP
ncbi:TPA: hypothetical protein QEM72_002709 [Pseudomonas putida]|uniref:hypothetical protein n=1 Tax=Pseudomonas putida TaxID=303 RepID=UPI0023636A76|nr:hypothetical protein [Pseudomonas putida]MDD2076445.1 hypothetical protein [Pseudomonas putida]HDS1692205.1 hypothetical protein [Pseudomonas putida]